MKSLNCSEAVWTEVRRRVKEHTNATTDCILRDILGMAPTRDIDADRSTLKGTGKPRGRPSKWPWVTMPVGATVLIPWQHDPRTGEVSMNHVWQSYGRYCSRHPEKVFQILTPDGRGVKIKRQPDLDAGQLKPRPEESWQYVSKPAPVEVDGEEWIEEEI